VSFIVGEARDQDDLGGVELLLQYDEHAPGYHLERSSVDDRHHLERALQPWVYSP
jgi:hypothetical protein